MATASAPSPLSNASSRLVVRTVFKELQRLCALHDSRPALKGLLENPVFTDPSLSRHWPRCALALDRFYGRGCRYYVDARSMRAFVKAEFRRHREAPGEQTASLLSDAFYALRMLKDNAARRNKDDRLAFSDAVLSVDPAAPSTSSVPLPPGWAVQPLLPADEFIAPPASTPVVSQPAPAASTAVSDDPADSPPTQSSYVSPRKRGRPRAKKTLLSFYNDDIKLEAGLLLFAHPAWVSNPFTQSVVLLTSHDDESGTEGVILNRPLTGVVKLEGTDDIERSVLMLYRRFLIQLQQLTGGVQGAAGEKVAGPPLLYGGPVPGLRCLHRLEGFADVSKELVGGEWPVYTGELAFWERIHTTLREVESEKPPPASAAAAAAGADVELFLGRCMWQPGQLREELRSGVWLLAKGNGLHVFTQPKQAKFTHYAAAPVTTAPSTSPSPSSAIPLPPSSPSPPSPPSSSSPSSPIASLLASHVPAITFPSQHLWAHCIWQLGGEWRHLAQVETEVRGRSEPSSEVRKERAPRVRKREEIERSDDGGGGAGLP